MNNWNRYLAEIGKLPCPVVRRSIQQIERLKKIDKCAVHG